MPARARQLRAPDRGGARRRRAARPRPRPRHPGHEPLSAAAPGEHVVPLAPAGRGRARRCSPSSPLRAASRSAKSLRRRARRSAAGSTAFRSRSSSSRPASSCSRPPAARTRSTKGSRSRWKARSTSPASAHAPRDARLELRPAEPRANASCTACSRSSPAAARSRMHGRVAAGAGILADLEALVAGSLVRRDVATATCGSRCSRPCARTQSPGSPRPGRSTTAATPRGALPRVRRRGRGRARRAGAGAWLERLEPSSTTSGALDWCLASGRVAEALRGGLRARALLARPRPCHRGPALARARPRARAGRAGGDPRQGAVDRRPNSPPRRLSRTTGPTGRLGHVVDADGRRMDDPATAAPRLDPWLRPIRECGPARRHGHAALHRHRGLDAAPPRARGTLCRRPARAPRATSGVVRAARRHRGRHAGGRVHGRVPQRGGCSRRRPSTGSDPSQPRSGRTRAACSFAWACTPASPSGARRATSGSMS